MFDNPLTREEAIERLVASEPEIRALGVQSLALFGSVARDEARLDSDVDLLVRFVPGAKTYDRFLALSELLEARLGRTIELVTFEGSRRTWGRTSWRKRRMSFDPRDYLRHIALTHWISDRGQLAFVVDVTTKTLQETSVASSAGKSPFSLDKYLSWMSPLSHYFLRMMRDSLSGWEEPGCRYAQCWPAARKYRST